MADTLSGNHPVGITMRPVGVLRTSYDSAERTPIQGAFQPDGAGTITVTDEYADGLMDIKGFTHLIVLSLLDRGGPVRLRPLPLLDDRAHGVFATRFPARPNRIGLTVVTLHARGGHTLHVRGVDMFDGTPVLDIKPYVPRFDAFPEASDGWFEGRDDRSKPPGRE